MARARELARRELVLHGHTIPTPGGYATDRQRHVYRTVAASVAGARRDESRLRDAWLGAIARYAVGPVEDLCLPSVSTRPSRSAEPTPSSVSAARDGSGGFEARRRRSSHLNHRGHLYHVLAAADSVWVPWGGGDDA